MNKSPDGSRITATEIEVRPLNADGDSVDVCHYPTRAQAMAAAQRLWADGYYQTEATPIAAVAVEQHVSRRPSHLHSMPDTFTTLAVMGDTAALELWGWQPGEGQRLETRTARLNASAAPLGWLRRGRHDGRIPRTTKRSR